MDSTAMGVALQSKLLCLDEVIQRCNLLSSATPIAEL